MAEQNQKDISLLLHPYLFVLKEGKEFQEDYLDYSLHMLMLNCPETIKSPEKRHKPYTLHPLPDRKRLRKPPPHQLP